MEWTTHALSGAVTGYFITGGDLKGALIGGIAGVIPDLDEPNSKFGKVFFPISIPLNQLFGHRTFTHSLLFAFLVTAIFYPFTDKWFYLSIFAGVIAHIVGDMLTGKVKLFYPFDISVGIPIPQIMFTFVDRVARVLLVVLIFKFFWDDYLSELNYFVKNAVSKLPFF